MHIAANRVRLDFDVTKIEADPEDEQWAYITLEVAPFGTRSVPI